MAEKESNNNLLEIAEADYQNKLRQKQEVEEYYENKRNELGLKSVARLIDYLDEPGPFLTRGILYAHQDFEQILTAIDEGKEWGIVSGLNPSGPLHFGHKTMLDILLWFQREFGAIIHIPITNDETYIVDKASSIRESRFNAYESVIPSIIALGFDPQKTRIYVISDYTDIYNLAMFLGKYVSYNTVRRIFGLDANVNVGTVFYMGVVQMAQILLPQIPEFGGPKPTLIPVGIDQHPYISTSRDVAARLGLQPPAEILWKFLIGLKGPDAKMASSVEDSAIYLTDSPKDVERKIKRAYSGGSSLASMQRERGGIPEIDPTFNLFAYSFLDDSEYHELLNAYRSGEILTGELKKLAIEKVTKFVVEHQSKREEAKQRMDEFLLKTSINSVLDKDQLVEAFQDQDLG